MSDNAPTQAADMKRITEVGVAVHDLDGCTELMVDLFGATVGPLVTVPLYGMQFMGILFEYIQYPEGYATD
jgi:hypothetical protein